MCSCTFPIQLTNPGYEKGGTRPFIASPTFSQEATTMGRTAACQSCLVLARLGFLGSTVDGWSLFFDPDGSGQNKRQTICFHVHRDISLIFCCFQFCLAGRGGRRMDVCTWNDAYIFFLVNGYSYNQNTEYNMYTQTSDSCQPAPWHGF